MSDARLGLQIGPAGSPLLLGLRVLYGLVEARSEAVSSSVMSLPTA